MRNIALALLSTIAIAGCSHGGHGASHPTSALDKILVMGKDTQAAWKKFMHDGGLQASDQWKGYTVQNVSLGYDPQDRLSEISLVLTSGVGKRTPSFRHISQDLAGICGSDWHKGTPAVAQNGDILCLFSPSKTGGYDHLEINRMEPMNKPGLMNMKPGLMGKPGQ